ncbi:glycerate-and formate-dehydrogenase [Microdochium trichocladiopsis]|uniref:Glycerate-and formate-dehydrogenase n=1 Tax=Microdochium trichocladiopsis TaxID=1682393 RepID=A0A9P9BKW9_9PEZI|nr:glycerate-and formate-dehydrogenase [Microdochium trichocladiopsis]KAH7024342.1 glycerate-and formate-dehydrogenase [Microdochium trichocladiopsis]
MATTHKPRVLSISYPEWAGEDYMKDFESQFELHVVTPGDRPTTIARVAEKVKQEGPFDAITILMGILPYEPFDAELLWPLVPQCKILASASAGYNEFDVDWMTSQGITFCNSRNAVNEATADLAICMILSILRDVQSLRSSIAAGTWRGGMALTKGQTGLAPTRDPSGLKLAIIGMGAIGKHTARKARAFNMKILYHQRTRMSAEDEAALDATFYASLDDMLAEADVISVHCPLSDSTRGLLSHAQFARMKDGVFIVNTCRGPVIDEDALIAAMKSDKVARAGLDVFHNEPNINPYFIANDRVMIQPHMGGLTDVAWRRAYTEALENVKAFFTTGKAHTPVNAHLIHGKSSK